MDRPRYSPTECSRKLNSYGAKSNRLRVLTAEHRHLVKKSTLSLLSANVFTIALHLALWAIGCICAVVGIVTMYSLFYTVYIPAERLSLPVYFDHSSEAGPHAMVLFPAPRTGVEYDLSLKMLVPDIAGLSEHLGNIMIETTVSNVRADGKTQEITRSRRPTLLVYRSWPVRVVLLGLRLLPVVVGWTQEATMHRTFLLRRLTLPRNCSELQVALSLNKRDLPLYETALEMVAHFRGLRYLMYYWRWTCALVAVGGLSLGAIIAISLFISLSLFTRLRHGQSVLDPDADVSSEGSVFGVDSECGSDLTFTTSTTETNNSKMSAENGIGREGFKEHRNGIVMAPPAITKMKQKNMPEAVSDVPDFDALVPEKVDKAASLVLGEAEDGGKELLTDSCSEDTQSDVNDIQEPGKNPEKDDEIVVDSDKEIFSNEFLSDEDSPVKI